MKVTIQCPHCDSEWTVAEEFSTTVSLCPFCGKELKKQDNPQTVPDAIRMLIERYGREILKDGKRLYSFLTDFIPDKEKELRIVKIACNAGVYSPFAEAQEAEYKSLTLRAVNTLINDYFLGENWAESVVDWLLEALGVKVPQKIVPVKTDFMLPESQTPAPQKVTPKPLQKPTKKPISSGGDFKIMDGVLFDYQGIADEVIVPDGVLKITGRAFAKKKMRIVRLPEGIKEIESLAFERCPNLEEVNIPGSVKKVNKKVFYQCKRLKKITVGEGVTKINAYAFQYCADVREIILPRSLREASTFFTGIGVRVIEKLIYNGTVDDWLGVRFGRGRDWGAKNVYLNEQPMPKLLRISAKNKKIEGQAFYYFQCLEKVIIEEGIEAIGEEAFRGCPLREIELPETLKSIGRWAFQDSTELRTIYVPKSVVEMGCYIFWHNNFNLTIYAGAPYQPVSWDKDWNSRWYDNEYMPVIWGVDRENASPNTPAARTVGYKKES